MLILVLLLHVVYNLIIYAIYRLLKSQSERPAFSDEEIRVVMERETIKIYERGKWREMKSLMRVLSLTLAFLPLCLFLMIPPPLPPITEPFICPVIESLPPPIIPVPVPVESETEILGRTGLRRCLSNQQREQSSNEFCYYRERFRNTTLMRDSYRYQSRGEIVYYGGREKPGEYFIDQYSQYYRSLFMMSRISGGGKAGEEEEDGEIVMRREIVSESLFLGQLDEIERVEGEKCICPFFIGIHDNISFIHYRNREWILMSEPSINRVPSDAKLVKTRIYFKKNSLFGGFISPLDRTRLFEHYDRFEVSFNSLSYRVREREMDSLIELNRGMRETFIFYKIPPENTRRISLLLEGESAICFIFCQHHRH